MFLYDTVAIRRFEQIFSQHFLMDIAGKNTAKFIQNLLLENINTNTNSTNFDNSAKQFWHILIVAGKGNNGGDAFATAKYLLLNKNFFTENNYELKISIVSTHDENNFYGEVLESFNNLKESLEISDVLLKNYPNNTDCCSFYRTIPNDILDYSSKIDLIIDGIFGIGLDATRSAKNSFADLISTTNLLAEKNNCPIISLDCPSGLICDTGFTMQPTIKADYTLTFIADKPGLHTASAVNLVGKVIVDNLDLDIEDATNLEIQEVLPIGKILEINDFKHLFRKRQNNSHKGTYGNVGILGGAKSMVGAAILAGRSALNLGAGRVFLGLCDNNAPVVDFYNPELMLRSADLLLHVALDTLVCGPGLGRSNEALRLLEDSLSMQNNTKLVLDADALNLIALHQNLQKILLARSENSTILTPHPAEAARLLKCSVAEIQQDRINKAKEIAEKFKCIVILKGNGTIITKYQNPNQKPSALENLFYLNVTGNPALATAGTGDILSGILGALLAQGFPIFESALMAVYLHGLAADELVKNLGGNIGIAAGEFIPMARKILNQWIYQNKT